MTKEQAKKKVAELIKRYKDLEESGRLKDYKEAMTRKDFILPLFEALGWDIYNRKTPDEVTEEEQVSKGRVDYAFRINSVPKFYLEAKAFKVDLEDPKWADQTINYAWHKGVAWAVLTDFEGLKIFNAEWKERDIWKNRYLEFRVDEYLSRFDELWLLSRENFEKGIIDQEAEKVGKKVKKTPVNELIFEDLLAWRKKLTSSIRFYHKELEEETLEECVQTILDRLIFIRVCEDREIEPNHLQVALREWEEEDRRGETPYERVVEIFKDFYVYNSELFKEHYCEKLTVYSGVMREIIEGLYRNYAENIRYDFSAIPADILGGIYEQYLGTILKKGIAAGKYRKERGIYYTPTYIVDYIVKNTVGKLLKDLDYSKARNIKILDPACGSGSFLIRAFEELDKYLEDQGHKVDFSRKIEVLHNNIYGVDLDPKAVEIARFNLLLRTLTGKVKLPLLSSNVKCGNSLISGTEEELKKYFGDKWEEKRPFNWEEEFKEVMDQGGFDVVIGNPPWSSKIPSKADKLLAQKIGWSQKNVNICALFIYKALEKLKTGGILGFLLPKVFIKNMSYFYIRKKLLQEFHIREIIDFGQFPGVASDAIGLIVENKKSKSPIKILFFSNNRLIKQSSIPKESFLQTPSFIFSLSLTHDIQNILDKIKDNSIELAKILGVKRGIELGQKSLLVKCSKCGVYNEAETKYYGPSQEKKCKKCGNKFKTEDKNQLRISAAEKSNKYSRECISGTQLHRYAISNTYFIPSSLKGIDYKESAFKDNKILIKRISTKIEGCFSDKELLAFNTVYALFNRELSKDRFLFISGLLNSKLINFFYEFSYNIGMNLTTQVTIDFLSNLPIRQIDFKNPKEKKMHDDLVKLVDKMLELNRRYARVKDKITSETERLKREIEGTDGEIDEGVYELYGITHQERKIIEGGE